MRKIYVDKSDNVASVVERILATAEDEIILYIPRFTKLASSNNFKLLKREIHSSGKVVQIESVDEEVLEMAKGLGMHASNPFFRKNKRPMSDIISRGEDSKAEHDRVGHKVATREETEGELEGEQQEERQEEMAE